MYLRDGNRLLSTQALTIERPFFEHGLNVRLGDFGVMRDARVAAAVGAERAAEGNVYVDGRAAPQRFGPVQSFGDACRPLFDRRVVVPIDDGRVTRITRPRNVILF